MSEEDIVKVTKISKGYSCADITTLCGEASMIPIRECKDIRMISVDNIRETGIKDFIKAFNLVKSSVAPKDLVAY